MNRNAALTLGVCLVLVCGGGIWSGSVQAAEGDAVKKIEKRIEIVGRPGSGFLGVGLEEVDGASRGARVTSVHSGSAADEAGLEEGDVITGYDGETVRSARQLRRLVTETPPGRTVTLDVRRDGATRSFTATLGERGSWIGDHTAPFHMGEGHVLVPGEEDFDIEAPEIPHLPGRPGPQVFRWHGDGDHDLTMVWPGRPRLGIRFIELGEQLAGYFGLTSSEGVLVTEVEESTPAAEAGLQAGDVLLQFDGEPIRGGRDLQNRVREAQAGASVSLAVQRKGRSMSVEVTLPKAELERRRPTAGVSL